MAIRAKFQCQRVGTAYWGKRSKKDEDGHYVYDEQGRPVYDGDNFCEEVSLTPVSGPENKPWSEATPSGKLEMSISAAGAQGFFKPGKTYDIYIRESEEK